MGGVWRTICSEDWTSQLGLLACRQLGYPRFKESAFVRLDSIEQDLQSRLVSIVRNQSEISKLHFASTHRFSDPAMWTVHAGLTELSLHGAGSHSVDRILYHHRYHSKRLDHDVALMRLVTPLTFNGLVEPICLPNHGEEFEDGTMCWISGWGATYEDGDISMALNSAMVPLLPTTTCNQREVLQGLVTSGMICAGFLEGGTDSCQGDSGGPLACQRSSVWTVVGATSWGVGCAARNKPGVYTRITKFLSWIHQQMERVEASGQLIPNRTTSV